MKDTTLATEAESLSAQHDKISVIVPVYNAAWCLHKCIDCILGQTYRNLEVILVDDGSTDASGEICDGYARRDERVTAVHQQNKGVAEARNTGLRKASGDFIAFIDNDDWIHPQYFELLHRALVETGLDVSMCYYDTVWSDVFVPDTTTITEPGPYKYFSRRELISALLSIPVDISRHSPVPYELVWAKLHRKQVVNELFFRDVWGEDAEYNSRLYQRTETVALVPHSLYCWIQSKGEAHRIAAYDSYEAYLYGPMVILDNMSHEYPYGRGLALKRMMLCMLSTRYNVMENKQFGPSRQATMKHIKQIKGKVMKEFVTHADISLLFKSAMLAFWYMPFTYNLFRWALEKRAQLRR